MIARGPRMARPAIAAPGFETFEVPLVDGADVAKVGICSRIR